MSTRFTWREDAPRPKIDADIFGAELERLAREKNGVNADAKDVVKAATDKNSPIHSAFEWDNEKAGHKYRLHQAASLIGRIQVVNVKIEHNQPVSTRAFHLVRYDGQRGYAARETVVSSSDLTQQIIRNSQRELQSFAKKFSEIAVLGKFIPGLNQVIQQMQDEIDRLALLASRRQDETLHKEAESEDRPAA